MCSGDHFPGTEAMPSPKCPRPIPTNATPIAHASDSANDNTGGADRSVLDEIVRDGARQMLEAALKAEVAAYAERFVD